MISYIRCDRCGSLITDNGLIDADCRISIETNSNYCPTMLCITAICSRCIDKEAKQKESQHEKDTDIIQERI